MAISSSHSCRRDDVVSYNVGWKPGKQIRVASKLRTARQPPLSRIAGDTPAAPGLRSPRRPPLQLNQSAARGAGDSLGSTDHVHLREDGFYVRFHCAFTDKESGADFFVALSLSHQFEHVDLTRAQCFAADALCQLGREMHGNTRFT